MLTAWVRNAPGTDLRLDECQGVPAIGAGRAIGDTDWDRVGHGSTVRNIRRAADVCLNAHMFYRAFAVVSRLAAVVAAVAIPAPALGQTPVPAGAVATPTEDDTLRFKMPTVTVTAQKEPEDRAEGAGQRHGRHPRDHRRRRRPPGQRRGHLRAEHRLHRVHGAQAEQRRASAASARARTTRASPPTSTACRS